MTTSYTLTGRLRDYLGAGLPGSKVLLTIDTNVAEGHQLVDYDGNAVYPPRSSP